MSWPSISSLAALTALQAIKVASLAAPGPAQTAANLQALNIARESIPEPTGHANLLARSGFTKVCGFENGNPRK